VDWTQAIGSGPYVVRNFEPGVRADFERWDGTWRNDRGWFDAIEMLAIIDPVARQNAMMTGAVDAIDRVDVQTVHSLERNPNIKIVTLDGAQHFTFPMRCDADPFTDPHIRNAVKCAVDRQEMVDKILIGYGYPGNDLPIGRNQKFYNDQLAQREYDPDKAKWHLKQAGRDSLDITLYSADTAFSGAVDAAQLYAASAQAAGINLTVERAPDDGYWANYWNVRPFTACYWSGRVTVNQQFTLAYACGASWNDTAWCNDRFNELLVEARGELDEEKRREMYFEMQEILHDDGGLCAPMFASYVDALSTRIGHGKMGADEDMDGERWAERWWFTD
ncbi:MAG TPA: ABC transporter substrate-binding protein, partial [Paracoccaceae bacterium]|nr:ABC transporter substrate-binding protein [Paracoccaceae bacterium]